jgi:hypothetical protein
MRNIMDEQEYKYQRSLIDLEHSSQMLMFDEDCNYNQNSSTFLSRKATGVS